MSILDAGILDIAFFIVKVIIALVLVIVFIPTTIFILKFIWSIFLSILKIPSHLLQDIRGEKRSEFGVLDFFGAIFVVLILLGIIELIIIELIWKGLLHGK